MDEYLWHASAEARISLVPAFYFGFWFLKFYIF